MSFIFDFLFGTSDDSASWDEKEAERKAKEAAEDRKKAKKLAMGNRGLLTTSEEDRDTSTLGTKLLGGDK